MKVSPILLILLFCPLQEILAESAFPPVFRGREVEWSPSPKPAPVPRAAVSPRAPSKPRVKKKYPATKSVQTLQCETGVAASCLGLGKRLEDEGALVEAKSRFQRGCALGSALACDLYGDRERTGGSSLEAALAYRKACDGGVRLACSKLKPLENLLPPSSTNTGPSPLPDTFRGSQLSYDSLCSSEPTVCAQEGATLLDGVGKERGLVLLRGSCDRGVAMACVRLGVFYEEGSDFPRALREYRRGCEKGFDAACAKSRELRSRGIPEAP